MIKTDWSFLRLNFRGLLVRTVDFIELCTIPREYWLVFFLLFCLAPLAVVVWVLCELSSMLASFFCFVWAVVSFVLRSYFFVKIFRQLCCFIKSVDFGWCYSRNLPFPVLVNSPGPLMALVGSHSLPSLKYLDAAVVVPNVLNPTGSGGRASLRPAHTEFLNNFPSVAAKLAGGQCETRYWFPYDAVFSHPTIEFFSREFSKGSISMGFSLTSSDSAVALGTAGPFSVYNKFKDCHYLLKTETVAFKHRLVVDDGKGQMFVYKDLHLRSIPELVTYEQFKFLNPRLNDKFFGPELVEFLTRFMDDGRIVEFVIEVNRAKTESERDAIVLAACSDSKIGMLLDVRSFTSSDSLLDTIGGIATSLF